jgi:hypothetical protein
MREAPGTQHVIAQQSTESTPRLPAHLPDYVGALDGPVAGAPGQGVERQTSSRNGCAKRHRDVLGALRVLFQVRLKRRLAKQADMVFVGMLHETTGQATWQPHIRRHSMLRLHHP